MVEGLEKLVAITDKNYGAFSIAYLSGEGWEVELFPLPSHPLPVVLETQPTLELAISKALEYLEEADI